MKSRRKTGEKEETEKEKKKKVEHHRRSGNRVQTAAFAGIF